MSLISKIIFLIAELLSRHIMCMFIGSLLLIRVHLLEELKADEEKDEELEEQVLVLESDKGFKQAEYEEITKISQYDDQLTSNK